MFVHVDSCVCVCAHMWATSDCFSDASHSLIVPFCLFLGGVFGGEHNLSLAWDSPSRPDWLAMGRDGPRLSPENLLSTCQGLVTCYAQSCSQAPTPSMAVVQGKLQV